MKTIIDNRDTPFTIDMYQTFNGDNIVDDMVDYYNEDNQTTLDYDDFEWSFDTKTIRNELAKCSIHYINDFIDTDIITSIKPLKSGSPKFYNYTTDYYTAEYTFNDDKLSEYVDSNIEDYRKFCTTANLKENISIDDKQLLFYLQHQFLSEDYIQKMYEWSNEIWYDHTEMELINK